MNFNPHYDLVGQHSFLGASKYHWTNYDEEKLVQTYKSYLAVQRGTRLHELAKNLIELGIKLPRSSKTLNMYVNDAIGYRMIPEQVLYFSMNCFGTADSILFKNGMLRIHDLKTGATPASMKQLEIYAALFCLEYLVKPTQIKMELRIYQNDEIQIEEPEADEIVHLMDKIKTFDKIIESIKEGGAL